MITDTHCHLDMKEFDQDRDEVIKRADAAGVSAIINPGIDLESSQRAVNLSQKYKNIYAAVGIQPEEIDQYFSLDGESLKPPQIKVDIRNKLENLAQSAKVVAIGECGLDYKHITSKTNNFGLEALAFEKEKQKDIFRRQLGTTILLDLPVIIHNRDADEDTVNELLRYKETGRLRGVFHCFTGTLKFAREVLNLGFLISFTGILTYPNARNLVEVVREMPIEKIMVETDSPFLAPQGKRGQRNEPLFVTEVVKTVAEIKGLSIDEVEERTSRNAHDLFHL